MLIYNTLSNKKEEFIPINQDKVLMYVCGPTVYDYSHLGHARMGLVFDIVVRYLSYLGYDVNYTRNITDIDGKIVDKSMKQLLSSEQVSRFYTTAFREDLINLNTVCPTNEPSATDYIAQMIEFIQDLLKQDYAYVSSLGDVYFDCSKLKDYGKLSKKKLDELLSGARTDQVRSQDELAKYKKNPIDFALWKVCSIHETVWPSPWGPGRPGWNLECSTMIKHVLGNTIDIHGGGEDLIFPHHENEIAQSEACNHQKLSNFWMHNNFVNVKSQKMSKSLGNFATIRELLKNYSSDTIRLFVLQNNYRHPVDFTPDGLKAAKQAINKLVACLKLLDNEPINWPDYYININRELLFPSKLIKKSQLINTLQKLVGTNFEYESFIQEFEEAMNNDFNTAIAISKLFALVDKINASTDNNRKIAMAIVLKVYSNLLGFCLTDDLKIINSAVSSKIVDFIVELRNNARLSKDFNQADALRQKLLEFGIEIMDKGKDTSDWRLK